MIYIFSALIVVAVISYYAGFKTGYSCKKIDSANEEPIDWDKWEEKDHVR